jgi:4-amino-4-deoxy-L-arabinose transferase-like glycosyltransferase
MVPEGKPRFELRAQVRRMRSPWFIFFVALFVRLLALSMAQPWPLNPASPFWKSGLEIVNIAHSIASHRGFSSPFGIESGPTAWIPPVYPYVVAGIFMVLGPRSNLSAVAILSMQALFSALTCLPLYAIAKNAFDEDCAVFASWAWALFPYAFLIPELFVWETCFSGFLLTLLCSLCLTPPSTGWWNWLAVGVLWGIAALTNTALVSVMPVLLLAPYFTMPLHASIKPIAVIILISMLVVCPWILRNRLVLGRLVPVRSNFGEELWVGNHSGGMGRINFGFSPSDNVAERDRYNRMGEIAYVTERRGEAVNFIRANPAHFVSDAFYRFRYFWFAVGEPAPIFTCYRLLTVISLIGILLALRHKPGMPIVRLIAAISVYPLVYYLTNVYARYRYPIEPFMMVFAGFAISRTFVIFRKKNTISIGDSASGQFRNGLATCHHRACRQQ